MKKMLYILLLSFLYHYSIAVQATSFEKMVMPGALIEGHKKLEDNCDKCHLSFSKEDQSSLCSSCHKKIATDIKKKKGFHGLSPQVKNQACKGCHTDHKGRNKDIIQLDSETFNHSLTDFPLKGQHKQNKCSACHLNDKKFREADNDCYSCHKKDDSHKKKLGKKCFQCHNESSWNKIKFDHKKTDFPLKGKHKKVSCNSCHPDNRHKNTSTQCYSCHAVDDSHKGRYGKKCNACHSETRWDKSFFNHDKKTKFKLKGSHKKVACDSCHTHTKGSIFKPIVKLKKTCFSCHKNDDVHNGVNGSKCQSCHSEIRWSKNSFNHNKDTKFKLRGRHKTLTCNTCHTEKRKVKGKKIIRSCYTCHKDSDSHKKQLGKNCSRCHNEKSWHENIQFNHDISQFPLLGQHAIIPCDECHLSHEFKDTSEKCINCHKKDDVHKKTLGTNCSQCHNPNGWKLWIFNHDAQTLFKLENSHENLNCAACHKNIMTDAVEQSPTCNVCHLQDDIHAGDFGSHCEQCHTTDKFDQIKLLN